MNRMNMIRFYLSIVLMMTVMTGHAQLVKEVDICIYGGTSAGVIAAYTASKAGKSVLLVEPGQMLGGMSSGGLGQTDIGNKYVVQGLALDFYRKLGQHYHTFEQWIFEPHVAENIFKWYMSHCTADVVYGQVLMKVAKQKATISTITLQPVDRLGTASMQISAKVFLDCTYEGDLLAQAGVSYHVGREDNHVYGETLNGVQLLQGHQFPDGVDPYIKPGDPNSGMLWGVNKEALQPKGTGDKKVQAYNYRIALTNVPENRIPITKPEGYDPTHYELLRRQKQIQPWKSLNDVFIWSLMPNGKTDINNRNGFSTDMIGMSWDYPEADYIHRKEIIQAHEAYTKGLLYFVGHDPSVPSFIREEMLQWGYPKDEYVNHQHWTPQLYIREARRMIGEVVMTQHHCQGREVVDDEIAYAAYTMDSHNCDRLVVDGMVKNEGNVEVGDFPPFPIAYRAITPKKEEATNLLVPVCLSASHIAYGSIRMEPVFMVLGQSAAIAACLAIDEHTTVQAVKATDIRAVFAANPKGDQRKIDHLVVCTNTTAVQLEGQWEQGKAQGYGRHYFVATAKDGADRARFNVKALPVGSYAVYLYYPKDKNSASHTPYAIFNGKEIIKGELDLSGVEIKGQTTSTWVPIGQVNTMAGNDPIYVELNTAGTEGTIAANAVLFVPVDDQASQSSNQTTLN